MVPFVVERTFPSALTEEELEATGKRMAPCLELHRVRYIRSFWSADRRRMICHYEAPDAEAVREVQRESGALFDTVWAATIIGETAG